MRCVVTGGSGFIGSFIVEELAKDKDNEIILFDVARPEFKLPKNVEYFEGDIRHYEMLEQVIPGADEVYDIAGVLGTHELMSQNTRAIETNVLGAVNVLECCRRNHVKRLFHPTKPNDWLNTYSITKFAAEQFYLMFQKNYNLNIAILKWFNAYGPRQHLYPIRKAIPLFIIQALNNRDLEVYGDGEQTVDLIYVEDIAKIAIKATRKCGMLGKTLDVGTGLPITVNKLAQIIIDLCNSNSTIIHKKMRPGEPLRSNIKADVIELKKHIDIGKFTDFNTGMKKTIDYYKKIPFEEQEKAFEHFNKRDKTTD